VEENMGRDELDTRTAEQIRADIDRPRSELGDDVTALTGRGDHRSRVHQLVMTAKTKAAAQARSAAPKMRHAGKKVGDYWMPAAAGTLAVAGAAAVLILQRRRAAKARVARNRWLPGFLNR
jgi:Protein of unknown function (DUF3618)